MRTVIRAVDQSEVLRRMRMNRRGGPRANGGRKGVSLSPAPTQGSTYHRAWERCRSLPQYSVMPAKAGIQYTPAARWLLDSSACADDDAQLVEALCLKNGTGTDMARPRSSFRCDGRSAERHRDEPRPRLGGLDPHQHVAASGLVRSDDRLAHVGGLGDLLAADLHDDVAGLQPA